ncbi:MAG: class II glutamine amidotransferase [Proteobacteria bacterium]|nr:class II glutamine amidotransferase [Pseudomonadota bacterium]
MCELFALSSNYPTNVSFSLEEFALHGGNTGPHKDGWGIAFFEGTDVRLIKDADAASDSPYLEFIQKYDFQSNLVISHIRRATQGDIKLSNTQPFARELCGQMHLFVHNGDLLHIQKNDAFSMKDFHPLGDTDSEYAYCDLMKRMKEVWQKDNKPDLMKRYELISEFARITSTLGPANFIYSDGEYLFAHGHKRTQAGREGAFPPGLHYLCRTCEPDSQPEDIKGLNLQRGHDEQHKVVLLASVPLSSENWVPLEEGEIIVVGDGEIQH